MERRWRLPPRVSPDTSDVAAQDVLVLSSPDYLTYVVLSPAHPARQGQTSTAAHDRLARRAKWERRCRDWNPTRAPRRAARRAVRRRTWGGSFATTVTRSWPATQSSSSRCGSRWWRRTKTAQPTDLLFRFPVPLEDPSLRRDHLAGSRLRTVQAAGRRRDDLGTAPAECNRVEHAWRTFDKVGCGPASYG